MKRLFVAILVAAALYSGVWVWTSRATLERHDALVEMARDQGWTISWQDRQLRGYPSRIDVTYIAPVVETPSGQRWEAELAQVFQLVYRPRDAVGYIAPASRITLDGQTWEMQAEGLRASFHPRRAGNAGLWPDPVTVESGPVTLTPDRGGAPVTWAGGLFATRRTDTGTDLYLRLDDLALDGGAPSDLELTLARRESGEGDGRLTLDGTDLPVTLEDRLLTIGDDRTIELPRLP